MTPVYKVSVIIFLISTVLAYMEVTSLLQVADTLNYGEFQEEQLYPSNESKSRDEEVSATSTVGRKSIVFLGDIMLARNVETRLKKNGSDYVYRRVPFLKDEHTYVVGNFEATIPETHTHTPDFTFRFSVNQKFLPSLREAGVTHVSLANNHTTDYGRDGLLTTRNALEAAGIHTFGDPYGVSSSSVLVLSVSGTKVAVIGIQTLTGKRDMDQYVDLLSEAAAATDVQVVYIHWGDEYILYPSTTQKEVATRLIAAGADVIIGHHPHVTQSVEKIGQGIVLYSLGNFIFDQYFSRDVQEGLVTGLSVVDDQVVLDLMPISSLGYPAQPGLMNRTEAAVFLDALAKRSSPDIAAMVSLGTIVFVPTLATSTEMTIMNE